MAFTVDLTKKTQYDELISNSEKTHGLPEGLIKTLMMIENRNNPSEGLVSPKGAVGLMQIMPATAKSLGIDPNNPAQAIDGAGRLMSDALRRFNGNIGAAIAEYNGGTKAAQDYLAGQELNPETAQYLQYAQAYTGLEPSQYGKTVISAAGVEVGGVAPSDMFQSDTVDDAEVTHDLIDAADKRMADEAKYFHSSVSDAWAQGWSHTLTSVMADNVTREYDPDYRFGPEQEKVLQLEFPEGLDERQQQRLLNSKSQSDFDNNLHMVREERDYARRMGYQHGLPSALRRTVELTAGLADPAAMVLGGGFGLGGQVVRSGGRAAAAAATAVDAAAGTALVSPLIQYSTTGDVSAGDTLLHVGSAAMLGAGLGALVSKHGPEMLRDESLKATEERIQGSPAYSSLQTPVEDGLAVHFGDVESHVGADGAIVGEGPSAVLKAAGSWDEGLSKEAESVQRLRRGWYDSATRNKLFGWADSEGVRLAKSENKVARFVGSMWAGDASGLGKQTARNAAVLKELIREDMQYTYIPRVKSAFESYLTPAQKVDYMAGGAKDVQAEFSRAVQLERYKHRMFRASNPGSKAKYMSEAPEPVQQAAAALDGLYLKQKELHVSNKVEHYEQLQEMDHVGYIEQKPDYIRLNRASTGERKAFFDMVKSDYMAELGEKIKAFKANKAEWIDKQYAKFEANPDAPGIDAFLTDPDKYFDSQLKIITEKMTKQMESKASHWWENAIRDPEARYQNSEASLLTLAKEMSSEWFAGKDVDADLVESFKTALTKKWSDTQRRELDMTQFRDVDGKRLYMLDMFEHDVFGATARTVAHTSGRVAMAKLGWRTEQDIADTLEAMFHAGVPAREIEAAKHISDLILSRAKGLDDSPLMRSVANMTHATMMGKLGTSIIADMPTAIGNLGVGGMMEAMGNMASKVMDGSLFVRNGKITGIGNELDYMTRGLFGHDSQLWVPQGLTADGMAMEAGGSLLRRTAAAARFTNTMSGANAMSKMIGTGITRASNAKMLRFFETGSGISEARLADIGLHPENIARIKAQYKKYGSKDMFGLDKWDDPLAREDLVAASHKFASQSLMDRTYAGENPKFTTHSVLGYIYSKFRAVGIRAQEKILVRNMTLADSNTAAMIMGGVGFATFLAYARIHLDAALSKDPEQSLKKRMTPIGLADQVARYTSVLGLVSEGTNLLNIMTGGAVTGADTPLTGTINAGAKALDVASKAVRGEATLGEAGAAATKLFPGANTYQMMLIKKTLESE